MDKQVLYCGLKGSWRTQFGNLQFSWELLFKGVGHPKANSPKHNTHREQLHTWVHVIKIFLLSPDVFAFPSFVISPWGCSTFDIRKTPEPWFSKFFVVSICPLHGKFIQFKYGIDIELMTRELLSSVSFNWFVDCTDCFHFCYQCDIQSIKSLPSFNGNCVKQPWTPMCCLP